MYDMNAKVATIEVGIAKRGDEGRADVVEEEEDDHDREQGADDRGRT
jgi:hypothetical protein